ncbi:hypothetical protein [Corynebacterium cystitidis]|uniref:hypothetical protein n=1 Tax=Corynebacterium cystitidis TaxID=35757 RepID=UPI00211E0B2C|nr:hypothetical protein [Corynebacterium cystitidis]
MAKVGKPRLVLTDEWFDEAMEVVRSDVSEAAEVIAGAVRTEVPNDVPVEVSHKTDRNGRPVSLVVIAHASGFARQAKHGTLTRAAAKAGLEVTRYKERG